MKKVITYGTYDMLHHGHLNLLKRANALGDYFIVGVTSDSFDIDRGKLNVQQNVLERIQAIKDTGLADEVLIEEYVGQKIDDIQRFGIDVFVIGSDWEGKFDYLREYCEVVYLSRTDGISSTLIREQTLTRYKIGIIGSGRIARKFVPEANYVNGADIVAVYHPEIQEAMLFTAYFGLDACYDDFESFLEGVDAVYIASPHLTHYDYIKRSLLANKHVLCEIPFTLRADEATEVYRLAEDRELVLLEASKTAFCPAFLRLTSLVKSGVIGDVVDIQASLSKLQKKDLREFDVRQAGGSMTELSSLPLLAMIKILGMDILDTDFYSVMEEGVDIFTKGLFRYDRAVASITLGLGVKTEGNLVISGTKGYVYVPAPWWKTEYFELRFEDQNLNKKFFYSYGDEGLRHEIREFIGMIASKRLASLKISPQESIKIVEIIDKYRQGMQVKLLNKDDDNWYRYQKVGFNNY